MALRYQNSRFKNFSGALLVPGAIPLDIRAVVTTLSDLTNIDTWKKVNDDQSLLDGTNIAYKGLIVAVEATADLYMCKDVDNITNLALGWKKIGSGANIIAVQFDTDAEAQAATGDSTATAGTYIRSGAGTEEDPYSYSKIEIDLSNYATNASLNNVSSNLDATIADLADTSARVDDLSTRFETFANSSLVKSVKTTTTSEFVTVSPTTTTDGNVTISVDVTTQNIADSSADHNGLATASDVKDFVTESIGKINKFEYEVIASVDVIPVSAAGMYKIYLVPAPADSSRTSDDVYNEYIVIKNGNTYSLEKLGDTTMRLAGYATEEYVNTLITNNVNPSINRLDSSVNALENSVSVINTSISIINTSINDVNTSINNINTSINNINTSINDINTSINDINSSINIINTSIAIDSSRIETLEDAVTVIQNDITDINSSINTINSSIAGLDASANAFDTSIKQLVDAMGQVVTSIKGESAVSQITVQPNVSTNGDVTLTIDASILTDYVAADVSYNDTALVSNKYMEERFAWVEINGDSNIDI